MKKKQIYIPLIVAVIALVFVFYPNDESKKDIQTPVVASTDISPDAQEMTEQEISKDTTVTKSPTILTSEIKILHANYPDKARVNEDIKKNPHTPSKTLMTFAKKMGPLMEKAFQNESDATLMVKELSSCAHDESVANAARAMCVTNTERLAETFPKLEESAQDLRAGMSPEIQKILDTNDAVIRK